MNSWGGKRAGAGRKRQGIEVLSEVVMLRLAPSDAAELDRARGRTSRAVYVRKLLLGYLLGLGAGALLFMLGGCSVYPGDGRLVAIDVPSELDALPAQEGHTLGDLICEGAHYWDTVGAQLRCAREALDAEYHIPVRLGDLPVGVAGEFQRDSGVLVFRDNVVSYGSRAIGIRSLVAHELGHAIGLGHVDSGVMMKFISAREGLSVDDIAEFRRVWH